MDTKIKRFEVETDGVLENRNGIWNFNKVEISESCYVDAPDQLRVKISAAGKRGFLRGGISIAYRGFKNVCIKFLEDAGLVVVDPQKIADSMITNHDYDPNNPDSDGWTNSFCDSLDHLESKVSEAMNVWRKK